MSLLADLAQFLVVVLCLAPFLWLPGALLSLRLIYPRREELPGRFLSGGAEGPSRLAGGRGVNEAIKSRYDWKLVNRIGQTYWGIWLRRRQESA